MAKAAPATPQRKLRMKRRSSPTFRTVEKRRKARGVAESPMLRRKEQTKL